MGSADRTAHVGFYLIDRGLPDLERVTKARLGPAAVLRRAAGRAPLLLYLGAITLITVLLAGGLLAEASGGRSRPIGRSRPWQSSRSSRPASSRSRW